MPLVRAGDEDFRWRSLWVYDCRTAKMRKVSPQRLHIWEASWCGNDAVVAIASPETAEHAWFDAEIFHFTLKGASARRLYKPQAQLGRLAASPDGCRVSFSEGATSDRGLVAGDLRVVDVASGRVQRPDTKGIDISFTHWQDAERLLLAGVRSFESVVADYHIATDRLNERWKSETLHANIGRYPQPVPVPGSDSLLLSVTGHLQPMQVLRIDGARVYKLLDFRHRGTVRLMRKLRPVVPYRWKAPDGREIHGWLMRGPGRKPAPLVMDVHGGPIWRHAQFFLGNSAHWVMLAERGFALFWPNPRGSTGRGQDFARLVVGDMCGADTQDLLSGLDQLVAEGIADPKRIGVTGGSYGGTMTNWLITQDQRFAAAVPQFPAANWLSRHLTSYYSRWLFTFLDGHYRDLSSKYYSRSPVLHAHEVRTPTLHIAGALDQVTPPTQALEFHNALREHGVESMLVTYPREGHGMAGFPARIDHAARIVEWFLRHMPPVINRPSDQR
jgi:dipeptidyl aminopeptidase/acylaminoacyl peptidase